MARIRHHAIRLAVVVWLSLLLGACAELAQGPHTGPDLPRACRTGCATPYGQILGAAPGGVPAYSNCGPNCVVFTPNREHGVYTGLQWQCVEFARRWLLENQGVVYGDVDVAADIWDKIQTVTRVADERRIPLRTYPNGSADAPAVGDLLVYAREYLGTGHVAVVTRVDTKRGTLAVAEQNYLNRGWPGEYAREIRLVRKNGRWFVTDPHLLGWKRVAATAAASPRKGR
jgi:hypothetical protein